MSGMLHLFNFDSNLFNSSQVKWQAQVVSGLTHCADVIYRYLIRNKRPRA